MSRKLETLASIALFRSLEPAQIRRLDTQCTWRRIKRGHWILNFQDPSVDVLFILTGSVRVKIQSVAGRVVLLRDLEAGAFFGELAAIDHNFRSAGIIALTDVVAAQMPASVFRAVIHEHSDACDQVLTTLIGYIRQLTNRINEFTTLDAKHRIYAELLRLSRRTARTPGRAVISPPPTHSEIAERISSRREPVAREIKALERAGLIERRRGALVLTDTARLERMINEASEVT